MKLFKVRNTAGNQTFTTWVVANNVQEVNDSFGGIENIEIIPGYVDVIQ